MTRIIEISDNERCGMCEIAVDFMNNLYCPVLKEERHNSARCSIVGDTDESLIKESDLYKELLARCEELEAKQVEVQG